MAIRCRSDWLALGLALALAACKPGGEAADALPPVGAEAVAIARAACEGKGGQWAHQGGGEYCVTRPADAGRSCRSGADCAGDCLARSMTCAPAKPLLGCNEVLTGSGMKVTQCVE
jgi:hypothetical protein